MVESVPMRKGSPKYPLEVVHKGDCKVPLGKDRMFGKLAEEAKVVYSKNGVTCPKIYECPRIQITPMIRSLRRCSAEEAMESICSNCDEKHELQAAGKGKRAFDSRTG